VLDLPADFNPRYELTLDVAAVPFSEALRYLGELAGVQFSQEAGAVVARVAGANPTPLRPLEEEKPPAASPPLPKGLTGVLAKPPEAVAAGTNIHRSTAGTIQPEKSGYVPHRSLSGWSTAVAGQKGLGVNCAHSSPCPSGACGCGICCCLIR
jgi:hypothetical protein